MGRRIGGILIHDEIASSPSTPGSGKGLVYVKTDGNMYFKNDAGVETLLNSAAEDFQDAVGGMLANSGRVTLTYNDATPSITADIPFGAIANSYQGNMPAYTIKGRELPGGAGSPRDLSPANVIEVLESDGTFSAEVNALISQGTMGSDAWTSYTPTWTQSATISKTVNSAKYIQIGKLVVVSIDMSATSAGTAGNALQVSLPVTPAASITSFANIGSWHYNDAGTAFYGGSVRYVGGNNAQLLISASSVGGFGSSPAVTVASGDQLTATIIYEAASGFGGVSFPAIGGWQTYTPSFTQGATINKTVNMAKFVQIGRLVIVEVDLTASSAGTAANGITIGLPVTAASSTGPANGAGWFYDASATTSNTAIVYVNSTTTFQLYGTALAASNAPLGVAGFTQAVASGDIVRAQIIYEAASGFGGAPAPAGWTSYTPALSQSNVLTKTVSYAKYIQEGKTVRGSATIVCTAAGTAANTIFVGLPVPCAAFGAQVPIGDGYIFDVSTGTAVYKGILICEANNTSASFMVTSTATGGRLGNEAMTAALANGDQIGFNFFYEAA